MAPDRITEIEHEVLVLHFAVTQLWVDRCEREANPVEFARGFSTQLEEMFDVAPLTSAPEEWQAQIRERVMAFFGQVVSILLDKTAHHDA